MSIGDCDVVVVVVVMVLLQQQRCESVRKGYDMKGYNMKGYDMKGYDMKSYHGHDRGVCAVCSLSLCSVY